jgi:trigger factor
MEIGKTKEYSIAYPDDYRDEDLQGREVAFTVTLHAVRQKQIPPLDDELAKSAGDYETLSDLEAALRDRISDRLEKEARERLEESVISALLGHATVAYPALALQHEIDEMFSDFAGRIKRQGFTVEGYLNMTGGNEAQLREDLRPRAEKRLVRSLVLAEVIKEESIEVEAEEMEEEVERISSTYGEQADEVRSVLAQAGAQTSIASDILARRALDRLIAIATGRAEDEAAEGTVASPEETGPVLEESAAESEKEAEFAGEAGDVPDDASGDGS